MKSSEILDWLTNMTNPTHELITEIYNVIHKDGLITVDKSDIEDALINSTDCSYYKAQGSGANKGLKAIENLLSIADMKNVKCLIIIINQNGNLTLAKMYEIIEFVNKHISSNVKLIFGDYIEERIWDDIKITSIIIK